MTHLISYFLFGNDVYQFPWIWYDPGKYDPGELVHIITKEVIAYTLKKKNCKILLLHISSNPENMHRSGF